MRRSRAAVRFFAFLTLSFCVAAAVSFAPFVTPSSASASRTVDTAAPHLTGIAMSPDAVSVAGLSLVPVTVDVHLTDDTGVVPAVEMDGVRTPFLALQDGSSSSAQRYGVELTLSSGTPQDGIWSATVQVPSTWNGDWQAHQVIASDAAHNKLDVDPTGTASTATLSVVGTHRPALTVQFQPDPVIGDAGYTIRGRAYFTDTNANITGLRLTIGSDNGCVEPGPTSTVVTDTHGEYSKTVPRGGPATLSCVFLPRPGNVAGQPSFVMRASGFPRVKYVVTATPDKASVPRGSDLVVRGTVAPQALQATAQLQLRSGSGWRTVGTARFSAGHYSVTAAGLPVGTTEYRVYVPNDDAELAGVSGTFTVEVTDGLAVTGLSLSTLVATGLLLMAVGGALVYFGRRRPRASSTV